MTYAQDCFEWTQQEVETRNEIEETYRRANDRIKTMTITDLEQAACRATPEQSEAIRLALLDGDYAEAGRVLDMILYQFFVWDEDPNENVDHAVFTGPIQTPGPI